MPNCEVRFACEAFARDLRHLERKHRKIRSLLEKAIDKIIRAPTPIKHRMQGTDDCWKLRVSAEFRLIYQFKEHASGTVLTPVALYAKNELKDMSAAAVAQRLL